MPQVHKRKKRKEKREPGSLNIPRRQRVPSHEKKREKGNGKEPLVRRGKDNLFLPAKNNKARKPAQRGKGGDLEKEEEQGGDHSVSRKATSFSKRELKRKKTPLFPRGEGRCPPSPRKKKER